MLVQQLSQSTTSFIGRTSEIDIIIARLNNPKCRLLTLVGPGGVGKTRLSIEVASQPQLKFIDEAVFVGLQSITSIDKIIPTIVDALDLELIDGSDPQAELFAYLQDKEMLLVLDNFEHLMSGVNLLTDILSTAPYVKLLVTSRERLRLQQEWVFDVSGLAFPEDDDSESLDKYTSSQLFLDCVKRAGHTLDGTDAFHVSRICRLVEGIPLAIELAASWIRTLPCEAIAREIENNLDILTTNIRNFPEKHRSMRAVFSYSWSLLSPEEQAMFKKLTVFQGGFRREAAEYVAGASLPVLASLVDRSLLRVDADGRYDLHELLRQFGIEQLGNSPEEASETRDRHCSYYTDFMAKQWVRLSGSEIKSALQDITTELNNVRVAWDWGIEHHKESEIDAALHSLWFYYGVSIRYQEGKQVFEKAVPAFSDNIALHGKLMARWAELSWLSSSPEDTIEAYSLMEKSLSLLRQVDAREHIAFVLRRMSAIAESPDVKIPRSEILKYLQESLKIYNNLENHFEMGESLHFLSCFYLNQYDKYGDEESLQRALQYHNGSFKAYQQTESLFGLATSRWQSSKIAIRLQQYHHALKEAQIALKLYKELGIPWGIMNMLSLVAYTAYHLREFTEARQAILEHLHQYVQLRFPMYYGVYGIGSMLMSLDILVAILHSEKDDIRAYKLSGAIEQQLSKLKNAPDYSEYLCLPIVEEKLSPQRTEALARGRERDLETVVKEVIVDLTKSLSEGETEKDNSNSLLTEREVEIIGIIADGFNSREVAEQIHLSVTTVRWYLRQIYSKLDVHSRAELIARAREMELLT